MTPRLSESLLDVTANGAAKVVIERPVFSQQTFDEGFSPSARPQGSVSQYVRDSCAKCRPNKDCFVRFLFATFPFLTILQDYKIPGDLTGDIVSGLTVGIMHIPQGEGIELEILCPRSERSAGASSNRIVRLSVHPSVCLSVIPTRL